MNTVVSNGVFVDERDRQEYRWVQIGSQIWMADNLRFKPSKGKYQPTWDEKTFGIEYNQKAIQYSPPKGWRIPSVEDWEILFRGLGFYEGINYHKRRGGLNNIGNFVSNAFDLLCDSNDNCILSSFPSGLDIKTYEPNTSTGFLSSLLYWTSSNWYWDSRAWSTGKQNRHVGIFLRKDGAIYYYDGQPIRMKANFISNDWPGLFCAIRCIADNSIRP